MFGNLSGSVVDTVYDVHATSSILVGFHGRAVCVDHQSAALFVFGDGAFEMRFVDVLIFVFLVDGLDEVYLVLVEPRTSGDGNLAHGPWVTLEDVVPFFGCQVAPICSPSVSYTHLTLPTIYSV